MEIKKRAALNLAHTTKTSSEIVFNFTKRNQIRLGNFLQRIL